MKSPLLFFALCLFAASAAAQDDSGRHTIITGFVQQAHLAKEIHLLVNDAYIDGHPDEYTASVLDDNTFSFALDIRTPQRVLLNYARHTTELYLEPGDSLHINTDAGRFPFGIRFSGKGGRNNEFLDRYNREFPRNPNQFAYVQYRSGIHSYLVDPKMQDMMQRMSVESFKASMKRRHELRLQYFKDFDQRHQSDRPMTGMFRQFMARELMYEYATTLLCYGDIFKKLHNIQPHFFDFTKEIPLRSDYIGSRHYREYMAAYINHHYLELNNNNVAGIFNGQYELAAGLLKDLPLAYFRSELITRAIKGKKLDVILEKYNEFLEHNPYYEFNDKVAAAYAQAVKYQAGSIAPAFSLVTMEGDTLNSADLRGKPVFLNFWATWCRPCMKKMDAMMKIQSEMEERGMVFVNVSFDRGRERWQQTINSRGYGGVHILLAEGTSSDVAKDYNVRALPQFFLIDQYGNFAPAPNKSSDMVELRARMEALLE